MTTPAKIEPCPFCGADGVIEKPPKGMRGYSSLVGCSNKDCRLGSVAFDSLEEWNRRAHAPKQEPVSAYCPKCSELLMLPQGTAIKEPSIPVSRLKFAIATSANLRGDQLTNDIIYLIHEAEGEKK